MTYPGDNENNLRDYGKVDGSRNMFKTCLF